MLTLFASPMRSPVERRKARRRRSEAVRRLDSKPVQCEVESHGVALLGVVAERDYGCQFLGSQWEPVGSGAGPLAGGEERSTR